MSKNKQCEAYEKDGSFMTWGIPEFHQCQNNAVVMLVGMQTNDGRKQGKRKPFKRRACAGCWEKAMSYEGMKITKVEPITKCSGA